MAVLISYSDLRVLVLDLARKNNKRILEYVPILIGCHADIALNVADNTYLS